MGWSVRWLLISYFPCVFITFDICYILGLFPSRKCVSNTLGSRKNLEDFDPILRVPLSILFV